MDTNPTTEAAAASGPRAAVSPWDARFSFAIRVLTDLNALADWSLAVISILTAFLATRFLHYIEILSPAVEFGRGHLLDFAYRYSQPMRQGEFLH